MLRYKVIHRFSTGCAQVYNMAGKPVDIVDNLFQSPASGHFDLPGCG